MKKLLTLALLLQTALLGACGAGLVTGGLLGNRGGGGTPPPVVPPRLALDRAESPLVGADGNSNARILFVNNFQVTSSDIEIELRALGVTNRQDKNGRPLLLSSTPTLSRIIFIENHDDILDALGLENAAGTDVAAELSLRIDGEQVGEPIPYLLRRQPAAMLDNNLQTLSLSASGTTRIRMRVSGLIATQAEEVGLLVFTQDPDRPAGNRISRFATDVTFTRIDDTTSIVTGIAPPSKFSGQVIVSVRDANGGLSTPVPTVFYEPELLTASSFFVDTEGGSLVTLIGEGLAPLDLSSVPPFPPDFDAVRVSFRKGGRSLDVDPSLIRREQSGFERLVFTVPHSPDGRPGASEIVITVSIGTIELEAGNSRIFVYGHRAPALGPRGALLTEPPRAFGLSVRDDLGSAAPQLIVVSTSGGIPRARLLVAQDNGMFAGFGTEFVAGDEARAAQRDPVDLCTGDWNNDGLDDLLVVNRGRGGAGAEHSVMLARDVPVPPLERVVEAVPDTGDAAACRTADMDRDGVLDLLVLPAVGAPSVEPRLFFGLPSSDGIPRFRQSALTGLVAQHAPYDAVDVGDADNDGDVDLVFLAGRDAMRLVVAYGDGSGGFTAQTTLELSIPGYTPDAAAPAVGVHFSGNATGRALVAVFAGGALPAPPTVVTLLPVGGGTGYQQPAPESVLSLPGEPPFVCSVVDNLDTVEAPELVVAGANGSTRMLRLYSWNGSHYSEVAGGIDPMLEPMIDIEGLAIGSAVPRDPPAIVSSSKGLFVSHRLRVNGAIENRISTLLAKNSRLVSPDAALSLGFPVQGIALGNFSGKMETGRRAQDVVVAVAANLVVLANDGSGGFSPFSVHAAGGAIPSTLVSAQLSLPNLTTDGVVYLRDDGLIGVLVAGRTQPLLSSTDLRELGPARFRGVLPSPSSQVVPGDVDGDGIQDLVVLLVYAAVGQSDGDAVMVLLRGRSNLQEDEFPWHLPDGEAQAVLTHGLVSDVELGDFVRDPDLDQAQLEVAVAIPSDPVQPETGNQVRFYRYSPGTTSPTDDRLVRSFAEDDRQVLIGGDEPAQIAAADLDGNGTTDLAIAANGDRRLHVFLNSGARVAPRINDVNVRAFLETFSGPPLLAPGRPTRMFLADLNGDGVGDLVTASLENGSVKNQHIAYYLSTGTGALTGPTFVPHIRTGNTRSVGGDIVVRDADMFPAVGDLNRDGIPDVVIGWSTANPPERNFMLLFGSLP